MQHHRIGASFCAAAAAHGVNSVTNLQKLLTQKQQLIERLEEGPGPNERAEIERLLAEIEEELDLLDEAGPGTSDKQ
jgi:transposase-like protein